VISADRVAGTVSRIGSASRFMLLAIFLLGVLGSGIVAQVVDGRAATDADARLVAEADALGDRAQTELGEAIAASQRMSLLTVVDWLSADDYEAAWRSRTSNLPGNCGAVLVLGIPAENVATFVQSEQAIDPAFDVSVSSDPPAGDHLIVLRSTAEEIPVGLNLDARSELSRQLVDLPMAGIHVFGQDIRGPLSEGEQLQLVFRSKSAGPDGARYDAWTIVQLDLTAIFADVDDVMDPLFGGSLSIQAAGTEVTIGEPRPPEADAIEDRNPVGPLELDVAVWSLGTSNGLSPATIAGLVGIVFAALITFVAWLVLTALSSRRKALLSGIEARQDHLTGIPNRRWVVEYLAQACEAGPVALMFCDLDRFKVVNDAAGHGAGDRILTQVVDRLQSVLDEHCRIARFGGDEFVIVCTYPRDVEARAKRVAAAIIDVMREPLVLDASEFSTTMSIGVAISDGSVATTGEELVRAADVALGRCKQQGRNGTVFYDDRLRAAELDRLALERDLRASLDREEFVIHYQPIVDAQERIVSYEALVRWKRNGELVMPNQFLPVVAEIGRTADLGRVVLRTAVSEFVARVASQGRTTLHVNVDAAQLTDSDFADFVDGVLIDAGLAHSRLILELTEGEWSDAIDSIFPTLEALSSLGVRLAIDDFGAGHSNIGRALAVTGLSEVKLDRALVEALDLDRNHAFFCGFTDTLLQLGVVVVAEGVETLEGFDVARRAGVSLFQGFYFARPAPPDAIDFAADVITRPTLHA